jgi:hypothetical protein
MKTGEFEQKVTQETKMKNSDLEIRATGRQRGRLSVCALNRFGVPPSGGPDRVNTGLQTKNNFQSGPFVSFC